MKVICSDGQVVVDKNLLLKIPLFKPMINKSDTLVCKSFDVYTIGKIMRIMSGNYYQEDITLMNRLGLTKQEVALKSFNVTSNTKMSYHIVEHNGFSDYAKSKNSKCQILKFDDRIYIFSSDLKTVNIYNKDNILENAKTHDPFVELFSRYIKVKDYYRLVHSNKFDIERAKQDYDKAIKSQNVKNFIPLLKNDYLIDGNGGLVNYEYDYNNTIIMIFTMLIINMCKDLKNEQYKFYSLDIDVF